MNLRAFCFTLLSTIAISIAVGLPAQAQRARVFVASYGNNANPCTFLSPCRTFQVALSAVAPGGEITAIDSAGFGPLNIDKAVTVTSPQGIEAGVVAAGNGDAIDINAGPNDSIVLRNLTLEGGGTGTFGIYLTAAGRLEIENCTVHNFAANGINLSPTTALTTLIANSVVTDIFGQAFAVILNSQGGPIGASLSNVTLGHSHYGLVVEANNGAVEALVSNSHFDNNIDTGLFAQGNSGDSMVSVVLRNVTLNQNVHGVLASSYSSIWMSGVTQASVLPVTDGINFAGGFATHVYVDGTNHIMSGVTGFGTLESWPSQ
jgi:hypothetical protein